ncbi:MAG: DNA-binding protein [Nitrospira sp. CG24E]|nr:MAG: DNA-binding protein [Nitrospira sp. CG24E]
MTRSRSPYFLLCRVVQISLSVALFLILGLAWLYPVALAADRSSPQINPQLQIPQDIPLERLERPLRTPPAPVKPVNLNTSSIEQLVTLPGISATVAQQIVEGRPYHAKTDLIEKHILSGTAYDRITNLITIE